MVEDPLKLKALTNTVRLSALVDERLAFTMRVATRRNGIGRYHLAGSDVVVHVRHGTADLVVLDELFRQRHYAAPAPVEEFLQQAEPPLRVVDLGANIGLFGALVRREYPGSRVVAFEPDPANAAVHRRSIEANGDGWTLLEACAATEDGTVPFAADAFTASHIESLANEHELVAALDVFPFLDDVDLLKIDIEGSEWAILSDVRFTSDVAKAIALEYHPHGCPAEDAQEHALALLRQAGYETAVSSFPLPPGHGVLWGWRSA